MRSSRPKVLHTIAGVSLLGHVLATAEELAPSHIVTVVRYARDEVAAAIAEQAPSVTVVDQDDVPGTGRAVEVGLAGLPTDFDGLVVVLSADVPMLDAGTLRELIAAHRRRRQRTHPAQRRARRPGLERPHRPLAGRGLRGDRRAARTRASDDPRHPRDQRRRLRVLGSACCDR